MIAAGAYLLYILSTEVVFDKLVLPLENKFPELRAEESKAALPEKPASIVVLGGGIIGTSPSSASFTRLVHAWEWYDALHVPVIVSGGNVFDLEGSEPEAVVDARFLEELGVDPRLIIREAESKTTWENAVRVKALNIQEPILLVTSAYHMPRAVFCFESLGLDVIPAPTDYQAQRLPYTFLSYLPDMSNLAGSYKALREYLGLFFYRIRT